MNEELKRRIEDVLHEEISIIGSNIIKSASGTKYFLKEGKASGTYRCEFNGLVELAKVRSIKVIEPVSADKDYILTSYIPRNNPSGDFFIRFGKKLAQLHRYQTKHFGFYENNYIGKSPQINLADDKEKTDWISFYFNNRLLFQYKLIEKNGYATERLRKGFANLESKIETILKDSLEPPCLLHGDLWAGNFLCDDSNNAVLIDPAVYYGHREADLAMTKLFGGFPQSFYDSYNNEYPLKCEWEYREGLYKLYHVFNHLNIFGTGYLHEAEELLAMY